MNSLFAFTELEPVVNAAIPEITLTWEWSTPRDLVASAMLHFLGRLRLPLNHVRTTQIVAGSRRQQEMDRMVVTQAADLQLECEHEDLSTWVRIRAANNTLPRNVDVRVTEALRFLLGELVSPDLVVTENGAGGTASIRAPAPADSAALPTIAPPIRPEEARYEIHAWSLFDAYLRYVGTDAPESSFSPLGSEWNKVLLSDRLSVEGRALVLSVAVEALLKVLTLPALSEAQADPDIELVESWAARAVQLAEDAGCPDNIAKRLLGKLSDLGRRSAASQLKLLAEKGSLDSSLLPSYNYLRQRSAHGARLSLHAPTELLAKLDATLSLLYQLVFSAIGYTGRIADYAKIGWRNRDYPLPMDRN